ncbi:MAG: rhodanese-like domain-containing protein, partial [Planctomycetota bacterium]
MICEQHYLACLAQASYLVVDERTRTAFVVDPRRDVDVYVERAAALGAEIRYVLLTHFHADFASGHLELAKRTGATICMGSRANATFEHRACDDGEELVAGDVRIRCVHTPGHTPESATWVLFDDAEDRANPYGAFTGDTLFVGDVGRPDLLASVGVTSEQLASDLYDSLRDKLLALPDATRVYPGHGPGSMCGRSLGSETTSTIGKERENNYALAPMSRRAFVELVAGDQPQAPAYFPFDARFNKGTHAVLEDVLRRALVQLSRDEVDAYAKKGAQIVDVRDAETFAKGHLPGSVNVGLDGKFATWAGSVLSHERPIVVVAPKGHEREAATRLGRIGFDSVEGWFDASGLDAGPERLERVDAPDLAKRLAKGATLLDVRTPGEWGEGHVDGALHLPLVALVARASELPRDAELVVVCRSGYRSAVAASWLRANGFRNVADVRGGMVAVERHPGGLPLVQAEPA